MITTNNIKKIVIAAIVLLLSSCGYDVHNSTIRIISLDGKQDTINVNYVDNLHINYQFQLEDRTGAVKANFVRSFSQLQTK